MKTKFLLVVCLGIFIGVTAFACAGFAATVGNAATTDTPSGNGVFNLRQDKNISIKTGFDFEFLFDKDIHASDAVKTKLSSGKWYMGKISYGLFNSRIEPYLKLGAGDARAEWTEAGTKVKLESENDFAWGAGLKGLIWDFKKPRIKLVGDGFYRITSLEGKKGTIDSISVSVNKSESKILLREWHIAVLAATELDVGGGEREEVLGVSKLMPYIGARYSNMNGRMRLITGSGASFNPGKIESEHIFGGIVGCDIVGSDSASLNVEGRFIDETAITVGLDIML